MNNKYVLRVCKRGAIYLPKSLVSAANIKEGDKLIARLEGDKIVLELVPDPFELALRVKKVAKITVEEFERESEEMQKVLWG